MRILAFFDCVDDEMNAKWSPQVVESLYWWFERWGYTYLFAPDNEYGEKMGVPGGGVWMGVAAWGVARMRKDVEGWVGEREVIAQVSISKVLSNKEIIATLKTFARNRRVRNGLLICGIVMRYTILTLDNMPILVQYLVSHISTLPQSSHS